LCAARLPLPTEGRLRRRIGEIGAERASGSHAQDIGAWPSNCLWHKRVLPFTSCAPHVHL
jgi:hypothetical protein